MGETIFRGHKYKGILIAFEGPDGFGKTTQFNKAVEYLTRTKADIISVREPGATKLAEEVRGILLNHREEKMTETAETFLFEAARAQLYHQIITPSLEAGKLVVSDRCFHSTTAYQFYAGGLSKSMSLDEIESMHLTATQGIVPDLTFVIRAENPLEPLKYRRRATDRMEAKGIEFHLNVCKGYDSIAERWKDRNLFVVPWLDGAADKMLEGIIQQINSYFVSVSKQNP